MIKYRKKPVVIEAMHYTPETAQQCCLFIGRDNLLGGSPEHLEIKTLEGGLRASLGDYIIRGVKGEFYPCKPDIFAATYERVEE